MSSANPPPTTQQRWEPKPWQARAVRLVAAITPVVAAIVVTIVAGRVVPRPSGSLTGALWWVGMAGVSTLVMMLADRLTRRLLPLASLLRLTLVFPDQAPSRFSVALRSGNTTKLEKQVAEARANGLPLDISEAAEAALALVSALNEHDRSTRGHSERVRAYSEMLGEELGLTADQRDKLRWGAILHDIGKVTVPPEILNKPGRPTEDEWKVLSGHPAAGQEMLAPLADFLGEALCAAGGHHERWDGKGYPGGLAGKDIGLMARIVAVADAYAVMTAARSYKKPMPAEQARQELARCAGTQFDPEIVRAFLNVSIGKLRFAMGPLAALANLPFGSAAAAPLGSAAVSASVSIGAVVAANVAPIPFVQDMVRDRPVAVAEAAAAPEQTAPPPAAGANFSGGRVTTMAPGAAAPGDAPTTTTRTGDTTTTTSTDGTTTSTSSTLPLVIVIPSEAGAGGASSGGAGSAGDDDPSPTTRRPTTSRPTTSTSTTSTSTSTTTSSTTTTTRPTTTTTTRPTTTTVPVVVTTTTTTAPTTTTTSTTTSTTTTTTAPTTTTTTAPTYSIRLSYSSNRSGAGALAGATIDEDDNIYVFVEDHTSIDEVTFQIYNVTDLATAVYTHTELDNPYDMGGTAGGGNALGLKPKNDGFPEPGTYRLKVTILKVGGGTATVTADFTVVD